MDNINKILSKNLSPYMHRIYLPFINELTLTYDEINYEDFLIDKIDELLQLINNYKKNYLIYKSRFDEASSMEAKEQIIIDYAIELGSSDLNEDKKALKRWFDFEALVERYHDKIARQEQKFKFILQQSHLFKLENIDRLFEILINIAKNYDGNYQVNQAALSSVEALLKSGHKNNKSSLLAVIIEIIKDNEHLWLKTKAYDILYILDINIFTEQVTKEWHDAEVSDIDLIFFKAYIGQIVGQASDLPILSQLVTKLIEEPNAFVRQKFYEKIIFHSDRLSDILKVAAEYDEDEKVKGAIIYKLALAAVVSKDSQNYLLEFASFIDQLALKNNSNWLIIVIIEAISVVADSCKIHTLSKQILIIFTNIIDKVIQDNYSIKAQNHASLVNLKLWLISDKRFLDTKNYFDNIIDNLNVGNSFLLKNENVNGLTFEDVGKICCLIASYNYDIEFKDVENGYIITRGVKKGFRLWRFLRESKHSSPDKRQNHSHLRGRKYLGHNLALSKLAELSLTEVPGEAYLIAEEDSSRPFLPLLDYCLSVLSRGNEVYLFSPEGITTITPSSNYLQRQIARLILSLKFTSVAVLRNWQSSSFFAPNSYKKALQKYGLEISFQNYQNTKANKDVDKYFLSLAFLPFFTSAKIREFFISPHANPLLSLTIFIIILMSLWFFGMIKSYREYKKDRDSIPLVIGGWGTRGKTGTERLKGAIFNEMGYSLVSKTSGCEPAITIARAGGKMVELPIYRPYRYVSIAEQRWALDLAAKARVDIMLWECMGLKTDYVDLIQSGWMKDDISTITNAHPDHENIHGPSGMEVAESISTFIRHNGKVITSEKQMLPILKEKARLRQNELHSVSVFEAELISDDLMKLFSYYEHHNNIALILKLSEVLGVDPLVAHRAMLTKVIPDIGALKAYIPCIVQNKSFQLINGMSANEAFGCLNNWRRVKFDNFDYTSEEKIFISTIVNNREDRIGRSRTFAQVIVKDLNAHYHFLIGTNLNGLKNYIIEEWSLYVDQFINQIDEQKDLKALEAIAKKLFIPTDDKAKQIGLKALGSNSESSVFTQALVDNYQNYKILQEDLANDKWSSSKAKEIFSKIFINKLIIIDSDNSDFIFKEILKYTPMGYVNKLIAMQNIKRPGIKLIEDFKIWESCYSLIASITKDYKVNESLYELLQLAKFPFIVKDYLKQALLKAKVNMSQSNQQLIDQIIAKINKEIYTESNKHKNSINPFSNIYNICSEIILKYKEQRKAIQIYKDVTEFRISLARAQFELKKLDIDSTQN